MLDIAIHNPRQHQQFQHGAGPLLLARAAEADSLWLTVDQDRTPTVEALLEIVSDADGIRMQMAGCEKECFCGRPCELKGDCRIELPAQFSIGDTRFEITDMGGGRRRPRPLEVLVADKSTLRASPAAAHGPSPATLLRWFGALGTLHRGVNSPQEFFVQAARCAVESIGLDGAIVLRHRDGSWEIVASHLPHPELGIHCDMRVLDQLVDTPRTMFHGAGCKEPEENADAAQLVEMLESLDMAEATAVVVSPLVNAARDLIGAIYGFRSVRAGNQRRGIRYLEAHLIELLANAVSEGIARIEHEAEVDRRRVLMEQAFSATRNAKSQQAASERREITLLFADLRGFSSLTSALGIEQTYALLGDLMDSLTAAVMDHDGMILDYYGDGLAAMWNAPANQADHPELACRAALRMIETLPAVRAKWADVLADDLRLGIGVHTGVAQVGNSGSSRRWKYGPRGANVHLASRVEAATKAVGMPVVVTRATASRLSNRLLSYRLCRVQMPGINEPVELYGIRPATTEPKLLAALADYQRALELFEQGRLEEARQSLAKIDVPSGQTPATFLAAHVEQLLNQQQGRRSTDHGTGVPGPVITLNVKN